VTGVMADVVSVGEPYLLEGRGWLYAVDPGEGVNPRLWAGQQIRLDGVVVRVKGVETFLCVDPSGMRCGVLLAEALS
jgi:hypothetical protein